MQFFDQVPVRDINRGQREGGVSDRRHDDLDPSYYISARDLKDVSRITTPNSRISPLPSELAHEENKWQKALAMQARNKMWCQT